MGWPGAFLIVPLVAAVAALYPAGMRDRQGSALMSHDFVIGPEVQGERREATVLGALDFGAPHSGVVEVDLFIAGISLPSSHADPTVTKEVLERGGPGTAQTATGWPALAPRVSRVAPIQAERGSVE